MHCLQHSHCLLSSATCVRATVNGQRTRPGCPGNTHSPTATCCSPLWQHCCPVTTRTETTWRTSSNLVGCVRSTVAATHRHTPSHPHADRPPSCARPERAQPVSRARGPRVERESQPERIVVLRLRLCLPRLHFVCSSPLFGSPQHCCWARLLAWAAWHFGFAAAAAAAASVATTLRVDAGADCSTDASVQFEAFACALRSAATSTATATLCNCDCDCHSVTVTCNCNCDSNWDCDSGACAISDSKNSFHILRERSLLFFFASKPKKSAKNTQNFDNFNSWFDFLCSFFLLCSKKTKKQLQNLWNDNFQSSSSTSAAFGVLPSSRYRAWS